MKNYSESAIDETSQDLEDMQMLSYYKNRLNSLFEYISSDIDYNYDEKIVTENMSLTDYIFSSDDKDELDYYLDISNSWFEVFSEFEPEQLIKDENKLLLRNILDWNILIWFLEDYSKIVLITKSDTINNSVKNILLN